MRRFVQNMRDIEYVKTHKCYQLAWGAIIYLKELVTWTIIAAAAGWVMVEITAAFGIVW